MFAARNRDAHPSVLADDLNGQFLNDRRAERFDQIRAPTGIIKLIEGDPIMIAVRRERDAFAVRAQAAGNYANPNVILRKFSIINFIIRVGARI